MAETRMAALYRMVLSKHTCPFGIRAKQMLEAAGFTIDDRLLQLRKEVNVSKAEQGVATAPQMFIDGEPIDGNDDLERYLQLG